MAIDELDQHPDCLKRLVRSVPLVLGTQIETVPHTLGQLALTRTELSHVFRADTVRLGNLLLRSSLRVCLVEHRIVVHIPHALLRNGGLEHFEHIGIDLRGCCASALTAAVERQMEHILHIQPHGYQHWVFSMVLAAHFVHLSLRQKMDAVEEHSKATVEHGDGEEGGGGSHAQCVQVVHVERSVPEERGE
ncbi:hypothetical protein BLNAU_23405 [Blattamonas nauphoetae]|uniref:Uncharacterized protein n=1 Tax=Blattamonas nauphoetae TaxID=2049346 RepID=A0ABQ9WQA7_9EUKA|nr:hypothetical protein BLNAU_23405 [Blattamonas nauphoetae]